MFTNLSAMNCINAQSKELVLTFILLYKVQCLPGISGVELYVLPL